MINGCKEKKSLLLRLELAIYFDNDVQTYLHIFVPARLVDLALNIAKLQIIIFLRILMREQKIKDWVISDLSFIIALQENLI